MTDVKLLKEKIADTGMTITAISRKTGILRETLYKKINGETEFKASEISAISDVLRLNNSERDKIFFASIVN